MRTFFLLRRRHECDLAGARVQPGGDEWRRGLLARVHAVRLVHHLIHDYMLQQQTMDTLKYWI